jgi:hypothetical protein
MDWCLGDTDRLSELGKAIRITYRSIVRLVYIHVQYCVLQYNRRLKAERQVVVQVVLLTTLLNAYQGIFYEVIYKYRGGDTSESSLVLTRPKDGLACGKPLLSQIRDNLIIRMFSEQLLITIIKLKCLPAADEKCLPSNRLSVAIKDRKSKMILSKDL